MRGKVAMLSGSLPPHDVCGVGDYAYRVHEGLSKIAEVQMVFRPIRGRLDFGLFGALDGVDLLHIQYPTEGWGNSVLPSLFPFMRRRRNRGAKLLLTLHEWSQMNRVRRASIKPLVAGADAFLFVTPFDRDAFLEDLGADLRGRPTFVVPIGVTLDIPEVGAEEVLAFRQQELGAGHDLLLTHFGFVNAQKQPEKVLALMAALKASAKRVKMIFIGGFQKDKPEQEAGFRKQVEALGLSDSIELKGFVHDEKLAATMMAAADANVSLFAEGLSSRRSSFWYAAQHGNALITTHPRDPREFERVAERLVPPQVLLVSPSAPVEEIVHQVLSLPPYEPFRYEPLPPESWNDIAKQHLAIYEQLLTD